MRVDLGGADVAVTEEGLDSANVGAIDKQIGSKRMAQGVRSDVLSNTGGFGIMRDHALDRARSEPTKITRGSGSGLVLAVA